jgi:hypothetical protein
MKTQLTQQTLTQLISFPFRDKSWLIKWLLGLLLVLIGPFTWFVPWIFVAGYCFRVIRGIMAEDGEPALPEWDDWKKLFTDGIRLASAGIIYIAPVLLVFAISFSGLLTFPVLVDVASQTNNPFLGILPLAGLGFGWLFYGTGLLLLFMIGFIIPAPLCHLVAKNSFAAAFQVNQWWPIFKINFGGFFVSFLFLMGFSMVFYFISQVLYFTFIFCFISPFFISAYSFYLYLTTSALYAQAYWEGHDSL